MENKPPLISVVIPVYKVEKYLHKCLDSVIKQTYRELEIILIDDGSPDESGKICDEYAKRDSRIRVFHKENGGQSSARNLGLDHCSGEYIAFLDSDDYVDLDYIEVLYEMLTINCADLAVCCSELVYENTDAPREKKLGKKKSELHKVDTEEALKVLFYQNSIDTAVYSKLYKAELFKDIRFVEGKIYEDLGLVYKLFSLAKTIVYTEEAKYYYLQRANSTVAEVFHPKKMDAVRFADEMCDYIRVHHPACLEAAICRLVSANFNIYFQIPEDKPAYSEFRAQIEKNIRRYRLIVLKDKRARKKARMACALSFLGFATMRRIWKLGLRGLANG